MPKKAQSDSVDSEEYKRFLETARQVEAEETEESFDRAFGKVAKPIRATPPIASKASQKS